MERLVIDISKSFSHIHSCISLSRADKMLCIADIGRGKLRRATTKGLKEVRMIFRAKPRDSTNTMGSRGCNTLS
jgi:hypothetical protein